MAEREGEPVWMRRMCAVAVCVKRVYLVFSRSFLRSRLAWLLERFSSPVPAMDAIIAAISRPEGAAGVGAGLGGTSGCGAW